MSKTKTKLPASAQQGGHETETQGQKVAQMALQPSFNAAAVAHSYLGNTAGEDVDIKFLIQNLRDSFGKAKDGDLSTLEAMLIGQATALQTIFSSLARRAQVQEYLPHYQTYLGLALKAQAQSRATIQAVVELKYPRQVAFVKQANISHGPQQVNNNDINRSNTRTHTHAEEKQIQKNELLEDQSHERTHLDTGTTATAGGSDPALETVATIHRTKKRGR